MRFFIFAIAFVCIAANVELIKDLNPSGGFTLNSQLFTSPQDGTRFLLDSPEGSLVLFYQVDPTAASLTLLTSFTSLVPQSGFVCNGSVIIYPQGLQYTYTTGIFKTLTVGAERVGCTPDDQLITFLLNSTNGCIGVRFANGTESSSTTCLEQTSTSYQLDTITTLHRVYLTIVPSNSNSSIVSYDHTNGLVQYSTPDSSQIQTLYVEPKLYIVTSTTAMVIDEISSNSTSFVLAMLTNHNLLGVWDGEIYFFDCFFGNCQNVYAISPDSPNSRRVIVSNIPVYTINDPLSRGFYSTFDDHFGFYNYSSRTVTQLPSDIDYYSSYIARAVEDGIYQISGPNLTFTDIYTGELQSVFPGSSSIVGGKLSSDIFILSSDDGCQVRLWHGNGSDFTLCTSDGHWQASVSSSRSDPRSINLKVVFFGQDVSCGNWSLWSTDGFDITRLADLGYDFRNGAPSICESSDKYLYITFAAVSSPEEPRGFIRTDGTSEGTTYFPSTFGLVKCGYVVNGTYYYFDEGNSMKISENGNSLENFTLPGYFQSAKTSVETENSIFLIFSRSMITYFDGNVIANLTVPSSLSRWGEIPTSFHDLFYFVGAFPDDITAVFYIDANQNLVNVANFSDSSDGAGVWANNNTLFVSNGVDLWTSTDGLQFEKFGPYRSSSTPMLLYGDVLYSQRNSGLLAQIRDQAAEFTDLASPQFYENTIWAFNDTQWVSFDVTTGQMTVQAEVNDVNSIPVFIGNGYSFYISGGDEYGTEPRRIPGPVKPLPASSSLPSLVSSTSSASSASSATSASNTRSSSSQASSTSVTQKEGPTISTQDENSGSTLCLSIFVSILIAAGAA